jgi:signal transduction histidine kinase
MNATVGPLASIVLTLLSGRCLRYWPLRHKLRISRGVFFGILAGEILILCAAFFFLRGRFSGFLGFQYMRTLFACFIILPPFFLLKRAFWQNLFLMMASLNYHLIVNGFGNYAEYALGEDLAACYPFIMADAVVLALSPVFLPVAMIALDRLLKTLPDATSTWRLLWTVPAAFSAYAVIVSNITLGADFTGTRVFLLSRVTLCFGSVATYLVASRVLGKERENAALASRTKTDRILLDSQKKQYETLSENIQRTRVAKHDFRHRMTVLRGFLEAGDADGMRKCLNGTAESFGNGTISAICANFEVSAVTAHYMATAETLGIKIKADLDIPARIHGVSDGDLCVLLGNMLENAVEACERMKSGDVEKFIRLRSRTKDGSLTLVMKNSFDGAVKRDGCVFLSMKRDGEGLGLSSIRAIVEKYGGDMKCEAGTDVFDISLWLNTTPD